MNNSGLSYFSNENGSIISRMAGRYSNCHKYVLFPAYDTISLTNLIEACNLRQLHDVLALV